jgi:hypothetical protein
MSTEELQVTVTHLAELAGRQQTASSEITGAVVTTAGVDARVATTHGAIAASTYGALNSVQESRAAAGDAMARASIDLSDTLDYAAESYQRTDVEYAGQLEASRP